MYSGPHIKKDGLVFGYDTGRNPSSNFDHKNKKRRFFKGEPASNLWDSIDNTQSLRGSRTQHFWDGKRWTINGSYTDPGVPGPKNVYLGKVFKFTSGALSNSWSGNSYGHMLRDISTSSGQTYTMSCWCFTSRDCNIDSIPSAIEGESGGESTVSGINASYNLSKKGTWQRLAKKATADSNVRFIPVYPRKYGVTNGSFTGFFMWAAPQVVLGSRPKPYIETGTSRSSTNSLIDLAKTSNIDVSNMSFDSDGLPTFDGTDDRLEIANDVFTDNSSYTLSAWLRPRGSSWGNNAIALYNTYPSSGGSGFWHHFGHDNVLRWRHGGPSYTYGDLSGIGLVADTWQMTTITWDRTTLRLYKNGVQVNSTTAPSDFVRASRGARVGMLNYRRTSGDYNWNGEIDVHKVYNRALTPQEIKQNFRAYKNRFNL